MRPFGYEPAINVDGLADLVNELPPDSWTLPDQPEAHQILESVINFVKLAGEGLSDQGKLTASLESREAYEYYRRVMVWQTEDEKVLPMLQNALMSLLEQPTDSIPIEQIQSARNFLFAFSGFLTEEAELLSTQYRSH
jgi:hypothetical protein